MASRPCDFVDKQFYAAQTGRIFRTAKQAYRHYVHHGQHEGVDPHRYFSTLWYLWQNPNWASRSNDPFADFINHGAGLGADPSYLVDMVMFRRRVAHADPIRVLFTRGGRIGDGIYYDLSVLPRLQSDFLQTITPVCLRETQTERRRRYLVHLQCGHAASAKVLCSSERREYDLLTNYYAHNDIEADIGEYVIYQPGTKFTAAHLIGKSLPRLYHGYRAVLFLDDDIEISPSQIDDLFRATESHGLFLSQPSLTPDSHCIWPALFRKSNQPGVRYLNAVEIMMPLLSAEALDLCLPHFHRSVSGFGLDLLFGHLVNLFGSRRVGIFDDISVRHAKPIDDKSGTYYELMRTNHINPKAELWNLIKEFGLDMGIRELPQ